MQKKITENDKKEKLSEKQKFAVPRKNLMPECTVRNIYYMKPHLFSL